MCNPQVLSYAIRYGPHFSKDKLLHALLPDPSVDSFRRAVECVDEMLTLQANVLPPLR